MNGKKILQAEMESVGRQSKNSEILSYEDGYDDYADDAYVDYPYGDWMDCNDWH